MKTVNEDLLTVDRGIILHGCNAQGVMGSGVAKLIRAKWPGAYAAYRAAYEDKGLKPGQTVWYRASADPLLMIGNAITQQFYGRDPSRVYVDYDAVRACMREAGAAARRFNLPVHYPMIGAGLGGGDWSTISGIIEQELSGVEHCLWMGPPPRSRPAP